MQNIKMNVDGNILKITVDLTQDLGPSKSGKTIMVATTNGNASIPNTEEMMGLNVYRYKSNR